ncbi:hypothetical protein [Nitrospirillum amazonense]|uniref:hypothetical protein n=1 Tax=Nitrospirillum amazonense TaxID=28077 RepID=UPI002412D63D|nr:hypothetical protein [Nitrospirillum amazonense]MDG3444601.1 hypothetical protein [Nitrospirillum amazonense]
METYLSPIGLPATISVGATVEMVDGSGKPYGRQAVIKLSGLVVTTACGRDWDRFTGGWRDEDGHVWPFPSIRAV